MSEPELEPCPHCGEKAAIHTTWEGGIVTYVVKCLNSLCRAVVSAQYSEYSATERWNARMARHADPATSVPPAAPSIQPEEKVFTGYSQGIPARAPSATSPAREWWISPEPRDWMSGKPYDRAYPYDMPHPDGTKHWVHVREVQPVTRAAERIQESAVACANDKDKPWSEWDLILKLGYIRGILWGPGDETRTSRTINAIAYLDEILTGKFTYADDGHGPFVIPSTRQGFGLGSKHKFDSASPGREAEEGNGVQLGEDKSSPKSVPATRGEVSEAEAHLLHLIGFKRNGVYEAGLELRIESAISKILAERALVSKPERSQQEPTA